VLRLLATAQRLLPELKQALPLEQDVTRAETLVRLGAEGGPDAAGRQCPNSYAS